jgi:hypothetical protein
MKSDPVPEGNPQEIREVERQPGASTVGCLGSPKPYAHVRSTATGVRG